MASNADYVQTASESRSTMYDPILRIIAVWHMLAVINVGASEVILLHVFLRLIILLINFKCLLKIQ